MVIAMEVVVVETMVEAMAKIQTQVQIGGMKTKYS